MRGLNFVRFEILAGILAGSHLLNLLILKTVNKLLIITAMASVSVLLLNYISETVRLVDVFGDGLRGTVPYSNFMV